MPAKPRRTRTKPSKAERPPSKARAAATETSLLALTTRGFAALRKRVETSSDGRLKDALRQLEADYERVLKRR